ncbi:MAG: hypothetical protein P8Y98_07800 [Anaerolineales bacterium]|jgi:hypothetical protein
MSISYTIDADNNLVVITARGMVKDNDMATYRNELLESPQMSPGMRILTDFRSIQADQFTVDGVNRYIAIDLAHADKLQNTREAIVTDSDIGFGMARVYQSCTSSSGHVLHVFRQIEAAETWLFGNPEDEAAGA